MINFLGLFLLVTFASITVEADEEFYASLVCSQCELGGLQPIQLRGVIKARHGKPVGYELFPGVGNYKFYPEGAMSYYQAFSTCNNDGAHLAIINSEREAEVLKTLYARHPTAKEWAYLGFNDMVENRKYVTMFGAPLSETGYTRWHPGQPDDSEGREDCGSMHRTGGLNDLWCDKHNPWPFFCEYELEGP